VFFWPQLLERVGELQEAAQKMILLANKRARSLAEENKRPTESEVRALCIRRAWHKVESRLGNDEADGH
jgi:hypothetical protein